MWLLKFVQQRLSIHFIFSSKSLSFLSQRNGPSLAVNGNVGSGEQTSGLEEKQHVSVIRGTRTIIPQHDDRGLTDLRD